MILGYTDQEIDAEFEHSQEIRALEKNRYAEVQTPAILINELLDQLPISVWSDPDRTWLDPAAGLGNFPMLIYKRLRHGLAKRIPDLDARNHHIFTKMLFMVELNKSIETKLFDFNMNVIDAYFCNEEAQSVKTILSIRNGFLKTYKLNQLLHYITYKKTDISEEMLARIKTWSRN